MAPFRRPGLQDDETESQPDMLRPRPPPSFREPQAYSGTIQFVSSQPFPGDEDSVVSGQTMMSDLESLYIESSSKNRAYNMRDQYLLSQNLPGQSVSAKDRRDTGNFLNGFVAENKDEEDNWEDTVYAATLYQSHQPPVSPKQQQRIDPAEQERLDLNRAIEESRLEHEKQQMRLAQIVEDDEDAPSKEKKSRKSQSNLKKKDRKETTVNQKSQVKSMTYSEDATEKPKKKGGLWSAFTGKKSPKR